MNIDLQMRAAAFANSEGRRMAREMFERHGPQMGFGPMVLATAVFVDGIRKGYLLNGLATEADVDALIERDARVWADAAAAELHRLAVAARTAATRH